MENSGYTNAPGKGFLKVSGILLIIFAVISILMLIIGIIAAASLGSLGGEVGALAGGIAVGALVIGLISCAFSLVMGILGVKYANVPSKAQVCMVFAIIAIALQIVTLVTGGSDIVMTIIGLVLPVLYLIGALKNKQAA